MDAQYFFDSYDMRVAMCNSALGETEAGTVSNVTKRWLSKGCQFVLIWNKSWDVCQ